ncbi:MAG: hypothetical protein PHQ40_00310 [Anaerolineaceae bacterium]|nr:hypothetical protein [Anaerolineaceae bacterium]MDD5367498.1 hypothetical protein [Anaerolineaceae bacterium]
MTAEIAVMNKCAVAIAADSAATVYYPGGRKIFNSACKLYMLSKYNPVGGLIYQNLEIMGVPWETLIKIFRKQLKKDKCDHIKGYAEKLILFVSRFFSEKDQEAHFTSTITDYFTLMAKEIDTKVTQIIEKNGAIDQDNTAEIVQSAIYEYYDRWDHLESLPYATDEYCQELLEKYGGAIELARCKIFKELPFTDDATDYLNKFCAHIFSKNNFQDYSGVVITGFGEAEIYPNIVTMRVEGVVNNHLKFVVDEDCGISSDFPARVFPLAQKDVTLSFFQGIDPQLKSIILDSISKTFTALSPALIQAMENQIPDLDQTVRTNLSEKLSRFGESTYNILEQLINGYSKKVHVDPILTAIQFLSKGELAAMAETLVNLTSFRRKMSMGDETVGGPIDVAVISKADGFVWIDRKHYFDPKINHQFFDNYYHID